MIRTSQCWGTEVRGYGCLIGQYRFNRRQMTIMHEHTDENEEEKLILFVVGLNNVDSRVGLCGHAIVSG